MKNWILLIIPLLTSTFLYSQNKECGFKTYCECDTLNESIENSFETSSIVIEGTVIEIDTISISEIVKPISVSKIKNDTLDKSKCAKSVLNSEKVIKVKVRVEEIFKGDIDKKVMYIITPLKSESCSYSNFKLKSKYAIYSTKNRIADLYFLWTFDQEYFELKEEYIYWTNKCKRTSEYNKKKVVELKQMKSSSDSIIIQKTITTFYKWYLNDINNFFDFRKADKNT